jgi:hypothetical protein
MSFGEFHNTMAIVRGQSTLIICQSLFCLFVCFIFFHSADFYDPDNEEGLAARYTACDAAMADLIAYMRQDGVRVAAFDATNTTKDRRAHVLKTLTDAGLGVKKMFVESICNDETVSFHWYCGCCCARVWVAGFCHTVVP